MKKNYKIYHFTFVDKEAKRWAPSIALVAWSGTAGANSLSLSIDENANTQPSFADDTTCQLRPTQAERNTPIHTHNKIC